MDIGDVSRVLLPRTVTKVGRKMTNRPVVARVADAVSAAIGALLTVKAYF